MASQSVNDDKIKQLQGQGKQKLKWLVLSAVVLLPAVAAGVYWVGSIATPAISEQDGSSVAQVEPQPQAQASALPDVSRDEVQAALSSLKSRVTKLQDNSAKLAWSSNRSSAFVTTLEQLYLDYAAGLYAQVSLEAQVLSDALDEYDSDYTKAYEHKHQQALDFFASQNKDKAELANNETLIINPDYAPALALKARLDVYTQVERRLKALKVAEAERDLETQLTLLSQVLALDPERAVEREKYQRVEKILTDQKFSRLLGDALAALANDDLEQAQWALNQAKELDASRSELDNVESKIAAYVRQKERIKIHNRLAAMDASDDWAGIHRLSSQGLTQYPQDDELNEYNKVAQQIIDASELLDVYIQRPERVYDNNIRAVLQEDLTLARQLLGRSATLDHKIAQVEALSQVSNVKLKVWFESDNKTQIKVIKVGNVGKTDGRYVELLPGLYRVEGRRKGYKDKLITLHVLPEQDNRITVICDEKVP